MIRSGQPGRGEFIPREALNPRWFELVWDAEAGIAVPTVTAKPLGDFALENVGDTTLGTKFIAAFKNSHDKRYAAGQLEQFAVRDENHEALGIRAEMAAMLLGTLSSKEIIITNVDEKSIDLFGHFCDALVLG